MRSLIVALAMFVSATALATPGPGPREDVVLGVAQNGNSFTSLPLNANQTMDAVQVSGLRFVTVFVKYVYGAATSVSMTCKVGPSSTDVNYTVQAMTQSGGTLTSADSVWTRSTGSASFSVPWTVDTLGYAYFQCTWSAAGVPTTSDKLTVTAIGSIR